MKALETKYRGIIYRSRTEARWAVFFNVAGIACDYEPEGLALDAGAYLPDFYLPDVALWFEVKPETTDNAELPRFEELCRRSGKSGIIAYGQPSSNRANLQFYDAKAGSWVGPFLWLEDRRDEQVYWLGGGPAHLFFAIGGPGKQSDHDKMPIETLRLKRAYEEASAQRFGVHE